MENLGIVIQKLSGGGAERAAANLSVELSENFNVKLIVFDAENIAYPYGGELINLNKKPCKTKIGKLFNVINRAYIIRKIKKKYSIKYSISFMEGANLVNVLSKVNDKTIISERNMISFFEKSILSRLQVKFVAKIADKVVAISEVVKLDLIKNFNVDEQKIVTIYNSCDKKNLLGESDKCNEVLKNLRKENNKRYIVTAGRLTYQKGQWHLIKAIAEVKKSIPNVKLLILGEGELYTELNELVKRLNLEDSIEFLGYIKNPHKIIEYGEIFVFPSIVEGLGNVILEAMMFGKPIISTDCDSGPREIIAPNTISTKKTNEIEMAEFGILTPCFNEDKLMIDDLELNSSEKMMSDAIVKLLKDSELKKEYEKASKRRIEKFSPEVLNKKWNELINNI